MHGYKRPHWLSYYLRPVYQEGGQVFLSLHIKPISSQRVKRLFEAHLPGLWHKNGEGA